MTTNTNENETKSVSKDSTTILDLHDDLLTKILAFALDSLHSVYADYWSCPANVQHFLNYRLVCKQFYNVTNPNESRINRIWERITRKNFPLIPSKLKCKRWDKFCRYRYQVLREWADELRAGDDDEDDYPEDSPDPIYPWKVIEGCSTFVDQMNSFYNDPKIHETKLKEKQQRQQKQTLKQKQKHKKITIVNDTSDSTKKKNKNENDTNANAKQDGVMIDSYTKNDLIFSDNINVHTGLPSEFPDGFKLKCPMIAKGDAFDESELIKDDKTGDHYYNCNECKKKVYHVTKYKEMKERMDCGDCVAYMRPVLRSIIIETNGDQVKAGRYGDNEPRGVFPNILGIPKVIMSAGAMMGLTRKDTYIGEEAISKRGILNLNRPMNKVGVVGDNSVEDWDYMERLWRHACYNELRVDPCETSMIMLHSPLWKKQDVYSYSYDKNKNSGSSINSNSNNNSRNNNNNNNNNRGSYNGHALSKDERVNAAQRMFETLDVPELKFIVSQIMNLESIGKKSGLVIDVGERCTFVVPVLNGKCLFKGVRYNTFISGEKITQKLIELCKKNKIIDLVEQYSTFKAHTIGVEMRNALVYVKNSNDNTDNNNNNDDEDDDKVESKIEKYEINEDEKKVTIELKDELFQCTEFIFKDTYYDYNSKTKEETEQEKKGKQKKRVKENNYELNDARKTMQSFENLQNMIVESISKIDNNNDVDVKTRDILIENMLLVGNNAVYPGFATRLTRELKKVAPLSWKDKFYLRAQSPKFQKYGAMIAAQQKRFDIMDDQNWLECEQYNENGLVYLEQNLKDE